MEYDGVPRVFTAPSGYVFDNSYLGVKKKTFVCTVGGFISPEYHLYSECTPVYVLRGSRVCALLV